VLLRSVRAHLPTSLATLVLAVVVCAGAVAVVGASRVGRTPGAAAAMLALYGAVALAEQTARATAARRQDVVLARLRGLTGARLVGFAAGPLLAVSLVGCAVGTALGVWAAGRIAHAWHFRYTVGTPEILTGVAVLAGAWLTIAVVAAASVRQPLADALGSHPRRGGPSVVTTFLQVLVVAAAGFAVYQAHHGESSWVPVVAPALVALAAGQVVTWLLALTPRLGSHLGVALTSRRMRRDPSSSSVVRILVAATVLLTVTLTGGAAAAAWRDDAARLRAGGPLVIPFADGAVRAYTASHDADPGGHWLMAAVGVDDLRPADRRVFVDARRWPAVVGDYLDGTSAASATAHMADLAHQVGPVMFTGRDLSVQASGLARHERAQVVLTYVGDQGYPRRTRFPVTHDGAVTAHVVGCWVGCSLVSATASGSPVVIDQVTSGETGLLPGPVRVTSAGRRSLLPVRSSAPELALVTPSLPTPTAVQGVDGRPVPVRVVGGVGALPFLGHSGVLLDLPRDLRGSVGMVVAGTAVVVARADTPAGVLARLHTDGGGTPRTYASQAVALGSTAQAHAGDLALLMAVGVGLVALAHLLAWLAGQTGSRRSEVASLRTAGVSLADVRRAYVVEAGLLAGVVLVAATAVSAAATATLLQPMRLTAGWAQAPPIQLGLRPWLLGGVVLGAAALVAAVCGVIFTRFGRGARPSALREVG
jgi:hypothetical protein